MKQLATLTLILSLLVSCEQVENKENQTSSEVNFQQSYGDYDGDGIPNKHDSTPHIADIPTLDQLIEVEINGKALDIHHTLEANKFITDDLAKNDLNPSSQLDKSLKKDYFFEVSGLEELIDIRILSKSANSNIKIQLVDEHNSLYKEIRLSNHNMIDFTLNPKQFSKSRVYLKLVNYQRDMTPEQNLINEIDKNCYTLYLKNKNELTVYKVARGISVKEALKELQEDKTIDQFEYSLDVQRGKSLADIKNSFSLFKLYNGTKSGLGSRPEQGQFIVLAHFSKNSLGQSSITSAKDFIFTHADKKIIFNARNVLGFRLNVQGLIEQLHQVKVSGISDVSDPSTHRSNGLNLPSACQYTKISSRSEMVSSTKELEVEVNGTIIHLSELAHYQFEKSTDLNIIIRLKNTLNRSHLEGFQINPNSFFCKAELFYNKYPKAEMKTKWVQFKVSADLEVKQI